MTGKTINRRTCDNVRTERHLSLHPQSDSRCQNILKLKHTWSAKKTTSGEVSNMQSHQNMRHFQGTAKWVKAGLKMFEDDSNIAPFYMSIVFPFGLRIWMSDSMVNPVHTRQVAADLAGISSWAGGHTESQQCCHLKSTCFGSMCVAKTCSTQSIYHPKLLRSETKYSWALQKIPCCSSGASICRILNPTYGISGCPWPSPFNSFPWSRCTSADFSSRCHGEQGPSCRGTGATTFSIHGLCRMVQEFRFWTIL